jgi:hypothetical protein
MRAGWRETFTFLRAEDVDGMVADLVERIRKRRREIESLSGIGRVKPYWVSFLTTVE